MILSLLTYMLWSILEDKISFFHISKVPKIFFIKWVEVYVSFCLSLRRKKSLSFEFAILFHKNHGAKSIILVEINRRRRFSILKLGVEPKKLSIQLMHLKPLSELFFS